MVTRRCSGRGVGRTTSNESPRTAKIWIYTLYSEGSPFLRRVLLRVLSQLSISLPGSRRGMAWNRIETAEPFPGSPSKHNNSPKKGGNSYPCSQQAVNKRI